MRQPGDEVPASWQTEAAMPSLLRSPRAPRVWEAVMQSRESRVRTIVSSCEVSQEKRKNRFVKKLNLDEITRDKILGRL